MARHVFPTTITITGENGVSVQVPIIVNYLCGVEFPEDGEPTGEIEILSIFTRPHDGISGPVSPQMRVAIQQVLNLEELAEHARRDNSQRERQIMRRVWRVA